MHELEQQKKMEEINRLRWRDTQQASDVISKTNIMVGDTNLFNQ